MKALKTFSIYCLAVLASYYAQSQIVADKTNKIKLNFSNPEVNTILPEITWEYPRLEYTNSQENKLEIKSTVNSRVPLKSVQLLVKRSLEEDPLMTKDIEIETGATSVIIKQQLYLMNGQNYLEVIAENMDGGIVVDTRSVIIGMDALKDAIAIDRKDYALLFATDIYDNWGDLVNPIYDAKAIAKELEERKIFQV